MLKHVERTLRGGTSQPPLSSRGALLSPREPATQAVRDGRDRPALILIPVMCCILRWMLLGGQVGLGIVIRPLLRSASSLGCLFSLLPCFHRPPCFKTTCSLDIARLGNLAGQSAGQLQRCIFPAWELTGSHLPFFLPYGVTHMCPVNPTVVIKKRKKKGHHMTGLAIMAGRLGAKTFCLPLAGLASHGLIA